MVSHTEHRRICLLYTSTPISVEYLKENDVDDVFQTNEITVGYWGYPDPDDDLERTLILQPRDEGITGPTRTLKIYNPQLADIEIRKKDAKFQDTNLSGAVFKVYYKPFAASDLANGYLKADIQDDNYSGRPTAADTDLSLIHILKKRKEAVAG